MLIFCSWHLVHRLWPAAAETLTHFTHPSPPQQLVLGTHARPNGGTWDPYLLWLALRLPLTPAARNKAQGCLHSQSDSLASPKFTHAGPHSSCYSRHKVFEIYEDAPKIYGSSSYSHWDNHLLLWQTPQSRDGCTPWVWLQLLVYTHVSLVSLWHLFFRELTHRVERLHWKLRTDLIER